MRRIFNLKLASILVGAVLLVWSVSDPLAGLARVEPELSPLDQLHAGIPGESEFNAGLLAFPMAQPAIQTPTPSLTPFLPPTSTPQPGATQAQTATGTALPIFRVAQPSLTPTAMKSYIPNRIVIPAIGLDAPVYLSSYRLVDVDGTMYQQWEAPEEFAAGWQASSAYLGVPGNTVLNGHHNVYGQVFGQLLNLNAGDLIEVYSGEAGYSYTVTNVMILPEKGQDLSVRMENARWLQRSTDERLTLITCWPETSNTHRLIVVAVPVGRTP